MAVEPKPGEFRVSPLIYPAPKAWQSFWLESLEDAATCQEFGDSLISRWRQNSLAVVPASLYAKNSQGDYLEWDQALALFLSVGEVADRIGPSLLKQFARAFEAVNPNMESGLVWFKDVLSLRHLNLKNVYGARQLVSMLLQAIGTIVDKLPGPTAEDYDYFYQFYTEVTTCLVSENYEQSVIEEAVDDGTRLLPFDAFSWFTELEHRRRRAAGISEAFTPNEVTLGHFHL